MDIKNLPDEDLIVYIREVDLNAYKEIVERYESKLLHYAKGMVGNEIEALKVAQDTFISIYKNINLFNPKAKFSSFAYRMLHKELEKEYLKKNHKVMMGTYESLDEEFMCEDDIEHEFVDAKFLTPVLKHIHKISPKYKEPLVLHFFENMSYDEISDILQISPSTVSVRLSVGKKLITKHAKK